MGFAADVEGGRIELDLGPRAAVAPQAVAVGERPVLGQLDPFVLAVRGEHDLALAGADVRHAAGRVDLRAALLGLLREGGRGEPGQQERGEPGQAAPEGSVSHRVHGRQWEELGMFPQRANPLPGRKPFVKKGDCPRQ